MPPINQGYIALYRSLLEWEWYGDINVRIVFIHCILLANHKEKNWRGIVIKRGQFISSRKEMARQIGITEQQFRTAINKLISTSEITSSGSAQHTVFTVVNYEKYQNSNQQDNQLPTSEQPASNQRATTTNNDNNDNNDNNSDKPQEKKAAKKPPTKKPETRINEDFQLSEKWKELALAYWASKNRTDLNPEDEFFKFKNHHMAAATASANWQASWSKWYSTAITYNKPRFQVVSSQQTQYQANFQNNARQMPKAGSEQ